ncbi:hypothetical protein L0V05_08845 [Tabrizicola sp. J26]|uniref:hypothetical protein n=1 Tax=Alitabrizicola rongguiensis TaxID=2909234 RepID=UPI001F39E5EE|nr:hypothetical protein [Tabrizicola rongguiensis]MCF1708920.1 hypothetical protein [Tabrizicola rongguiensis]
MNTAVSLLSAVMVIALATAGQAKTVSQREYERGYKDCSQGRYDQNQHGESYKKGCRAAEDGQPMTPPAAGQAAPSSSGKAKISDLQGMDSIKAIDVIMSRGFNDVDSFSSGDTLYGIYYNPKTLQCVQVTNANNRVVSADDIGTHPNCH